MGGRSARSSSSSASPSRSPCSCRCSCRSRSTRCCRASGPIPKWSTAEHGGHAGAATTRNPDPPRRLRVQRLVRARRGPLPGWLAWALGHRALVLGVAASIVVVGMLILPRLGFTWMPDVDGGEFDGRTSARRRARASSTRSRRGTRSRTSCSQQPEVEFTYSVDAAAASAARPTAGRSTSAQAASTSASARWPRSRRTCAASCGSIPGVRPTISGQRSPSSAACGQPIQIYVQGPEATRLKIAAEQVLEAVRDDARRRRAEFERRRRDPAARRARRPAAGVGARASASAAIGVHAPAALRRVSAPRAGRIRRATRTTSSSCIPTRCARRPPTCREHPGAEHERRSDATRAAVDGAALAGRRHPRRRRAAADRAPPARAAGLDLRRRAARATRWATSPTDAKHAIDAHRASAGLSHRLRRRRAEPRGDQGLRARGAPPRRRLHLPDPGVAVRLVPPAAGDHARAAAQLHRRRARAAAHRRATST